MKKFFYFLFILAITSLAHSEELPFKFQRMITDLKGIAYNDSVVVTYGDYGIIMQSYDKGETWMQYNLGDREDVKKIIRKGSDLVGLTSYSMIKSTNNGKSWVKKSVSAFPECIAVANREYWHYILTPDAVLIADLELNVSKKIFLHLGGEISYRDIEADADYLYILAGDTLILRYNFVEGRLDTLHPMVNVSKDYIRIKEMNLFDGKIALTLSMSESLLPQDQYLAITLSEDQGETWGGETTKSHLGACYDVSKYGVYVMFPGGWGHNSWCMRLTLLYPEMFKKISDVETRKVTYQTALDRMVYIYEKDQFRIAYNDLEWLDNDIILAVGTDKMICRSKDGGVTWEIKSFFRDYVYKNEDNYSSSEKASPYMANDSTVYIIQPYRKEYYMERPAIIYKTTNGGATWLPQKFNPDTFCLSGYPLEYAFSSSGTGIIILFDYGDEERFNLMKTKDFGETWTYETSYSHQKNTHYWSPRKMYEKDGEFIFYRNNNIPISNDNTSYLYFYDKNLDFKDSLIIPGFYIDGIFSYKNNLYSSGMHHRFDNYDDFTYNIHYSSDNGKSWNKLINISGLDSTHFGIRKQPYLFKDNLFITKKGWFEDYYYLYNMYNGKIRQLRFGIKSKDAGEDYFDIDGNLFIIDNKGALIYSDLTHVQEWIELKLKDVFYDWDDSLNIILYASFKNYPIQTNYLVTGKYDGMDNYFGKSYLTNIVKVWGDYKTDAEDNPSVHSNISFSPPYPQPARDYVNIPIKWKAVGFDERPLVNIYDREGRKLSGAILSFERSGEGEGVIKWNCSGIAAGAYYMEVESIYGVLKVPVSVIK